MCSQLINPQVNFSIVLAALTYGLIFVKALSLNDSMYKINIKFYYDSEPLISDTHKDYKLSIILLCM